MFSLKRLLGFGAPAGVVDTPSPGIPPSVSDDREHTVVFLGAGATAACGGPLTNQILPQAFELLRTDPTYDREVFSQAVKAFLEENFHLSANGRSDASAFPPLPLLLSLVDTAIEKGEGFGGRWSGDELRTVRHGIEYLTFIILEKSLSTLPVNPHWDLFDELVSRHHKLTVISLNYDIVADNTLTRLLVGFPDYVCDIATALYQEARVYPGSREAIELLKLHGSLNWIYCPNPVCNRLDVGLSRNGGMFVKAREELYKEAELDGRYTCAGTPCPNCGTTVRPVMITPTQRMDYENPHIRKAWERAKDALRSADHVHIVGYSLPPEDVDVIYLLKQNLSHLSPDRIHVVDFDPQQRLLHEHPSGMGYRSLFGDTIDWRTDGFAKYVESFTGRRPASAVESSPPPPGIVRA